MTIEHIGQIKPAVKNARKHNSRNVGMIERSLESEGFGRSILLAADGSLIAGSGTVDAANNVGLENVQVVDSDGTRIIAVRRTDVEPGSERAHKLAIADNRTSDLSAFDPAVLAELSAEVDLSAFWFEDELDALLAGVADEPHPPIDDPGAEMDRAGELQQKWQTARGQLWQIGRHWLRCDDSADVEPMWYAECETLVFDPEWDADVSTPRPFAATLAFGDGSMVGDITHRLGDPTWVFAWDCVTSWYVPNRPLRRMKLCCWYGDVATYDFDGYHYGDAGTAHTVANTRGSYAFVPDPRGKHLSDVFQSPITEEHADGLHAHSKPLDWIALLIGNCTTGDVYDPYAGSGTTLAACERLGRTCRAVEIEPRYVAVILERMAGMGITPVLVTGA